jgi:hypothetical protein
MVVTVNETSTSQWLEDARQVAATPLFQGSIEGLAGRVKPALDAPRALDAAIDAAIEAAEGDVAAALLLACAAAGRRPEARRVAPVLPLVQDDLVLEALAAAATGMRVTTLIDAAASGRLDAPATALLLLMATALLDGAPPPPRLVAELRLLAREELEPESGDMVASCAKALKDPHLLAIAEHWTQELARSGEGPLDLHALRRRLNGPALALLPEEAEAPTIEGDGTPLRAVEKVGRNDPCPCGSGKKFKKCCEKAGKPAAAAAPAPADEAAEAAAPPLLRPAELVKLDPTGMTTSQLVEPYHQAIALGLWGPAERLADALVERARDGDDEGAAPEEAAGAEEAAGEEPIPPDAFRMELIASALYAGETAVVLRQLERMHPDVRESFDGRVLAAVAAPGPDALGRLEEAAAEALRGEGEAHRVDVLALRVLARYPALGTLLVRASLDPDETEDQAWLLDEVERARDRLLLPPGDPYFDILDAMKRDAEAQVRAAEKARQGKKGKRAPAPDEPEVKPEVLRERLRAAATRASELEEEVKRLRSRVRDEGRGAARERAAPAPADAGEVQRLREKVEELKALLGTSQEERRELRRELEAARERLDEEARARGATEAERRDDDDDDDESASEALGESLDERRPALVPVFTDTAAAAIREADRALGRAALRIVSGVAGGDPQVWGQVKRLRRRTDVCTARVGIHHRLLFRLQTARGELEVMSFINRRELDATIRRLG